MPEPRLEVWRLPVSTDLQTVFGDRTPCPPRGANARRQGQAAGRPHDVTGPSLMYSRHGTEERFDLILHVGMGKTGTSSLQGLLRTNSAMLAEHGTLYPTTPGGQRHARFGLYVTPDDEFPDSREARKQIRHQKWQPSIQESPDAFRQAFRSGLLQEIDASGPSRVILSDEALFRSRAGALRLVRAFTDRHARHLRVVCYLRRQDDHLVSRYQQAVKWGEIRRLVDRTPSLDFSTLYDYASQLGAWQQIVDPAELVVRRFSREAFVGDSLYQDFLSSCGLDIGVEDLEPVQRKNESLDAESVEFLRLLNVYKVRHRHRRPGHIDNRRLVRRLAEASRGPTLTLPGPVLDSFMEHWQDANREVARRWFGESGDLFPPSRRTEGATSRQYLDPDRLAFYLDVTRLPERLHTPLRRLVEQEAG